MADDYTFAEGGSTTGRATDIGDGKKHPHVKLEFGGTGSATQVSDTSPIPVKAIAGTIGDGRQTVTTTGTEVQLSGSSVPCLTVTITAELDNTDIVVIGASTVVAALATRRGTPLSPGESVTLAIDNLNKVYIDAVVNTEGVTYSYLAA